MTTPVFKLTKGARYLDLQSGRYNVYPDWAPPSVSEIPLFAEGTSANRGGAVLVDSRPVNRQMSLPLNVRGSSDAEIRRGVADLQSMLSQAGDENEPLYMEFRPNSDTPEPLWGNYGANLRYEIVHGVAQIADSYGRGNRLATSADVVLSLTIKPYAIGKAQRLLSAYGGIVEDVIGVSNGISRGLIIPEATTNKMTNPIFGHSTWNNGWTDSASMGAQETEARFVLFGLSSARLVNTSGTAQVFTQSINVGNTNTHILTCYAKLPDSGAVDSTVCTLYYNSVSLTTTFTAVGDGWYRLQASATGVNASVTAGIRIAARRAVIAAGFQLEEKTLYATPLCYGDMLGCAWTGTDHASTSTRTAAFLGTADATNILSKMQGAIRVVIKAPFGSTVGQRFYFFSANSPAAFEGFFFDTNDTIVFGDGTNQAASSAQTFAAGDVLVLHFVYGPNGLKIYVNGSVNGTNGTYTPPAFSGAFYVGRDQAGTYRANGTMFDFSTFDTELTAAQVSADYTNVAQLTADDQRVSTIPWLWTKDGDDVVDNCDDSSRDNWAVAGGVPGSADARTEIYSTKSSSSAITLYLGQSPFDYTDWLPPITRGSYEDFGGSADANSSGGERKQEAGVAAYQEYSAITKTAHPISGKAHVIARLGGTGGSWTVNSYFSYSLTGVAFGASASKTVASPAALTGYYFGSALMPVARERSPIAQLYAVLIGSIGGGVTGYTDVLMVIFGRLMKVGTTSTYTGLFIDGLNGAETSSSVPSNPVNVFGDPIELSPNRANTITSILLDSSDAWTITRTLTFDKIIVTPRYSLL